MEKIYESPNGASVYVGGDVDYEKIKDKDNWKSARMCKEGPGGHRDTVGYESKGAPKDKNYLAVRVKNRIAVNIIDPNDPNLIPFECIKLALDYIKEQLDKGFNVLVACNMGHSRGPSTGLAFLRSIGDMPHNFHTSETIYKGIYNKYDPAMGIRQVLRSHWTELDNMENKNAPESSR